MRTELRATDSPMVAAWFRGDASLAPSMGADHNLTALEVEAWLTTRARDQALLMIDDDASLAGVVTVHPRVGSDAGIVHFLVAPSMRGRGIAIAKSALAHASALGFTRLVAPAAPCIPVKVHQRWLRQAGFTLVAHGEWHA